jgi:KUP system potassium uptake protein
VSEHPRTPLTILTVGALGVVFGDIGTSPLYAIKESFHPHSGHELAVNPETVVGIISLVFWSMIVVISIKYLRFVMQADNHGEGGILALTALIRPAPGAKMRTPILVLLGLFGASLLYGDGMITPAISVLSAVEGTTIVTESLDDWVMPMAVVILIVLFSVQRRGTAAVGRAFGPIMVVWFTVLTVLGLSHIKDAPEIFKAVNPWYGLQFFAENGLSGFLALGSVFLVVTGGEALYADMGHFGRRPIRLGWYSVVMPGLMINYFGQGAMLLEHPDRIDNPFFRMAPEWSLVPLVILATCATVIASQALISGAFSLTKQAVQLGYLPRVRITHTSEDAEGQIYVPVINWVLLIACIGLVIGFKTSSNLAAAYGLAVTGTMAITTVLFYAYARQRMGWSKFKAGSLSSVFLLIDLGFLGANIPKIPAGGWFPLLIGFLLLTLLTTWFAGRRLTFERIMSRNLSLDDFIEGVRQSPPLRGPGVGVYLGSNSGITPQALSSHYRHASVLPEHVCVLAVVVENQPHIERDQQLIHEDLGSGFHRLVYHVGFMDDVDVPKTLHELGPDVAHLDFDRSSYVLGRETLKVTRRPGMAVWRERLFVLMLRNASTADAYFKLPPDQTIELGVQVEL